MVGLGVDYVGHQFGDLRVLKLAGYVKHGRNRVKIWHCECLRCNKNTLDVVQTSLVKGIVGACKTCRRGPCVICGAAITDDSFSVKRNTCSSLCQKEQKRRKEQKLYSKNVLIDNEFNKKCYKQRLERDPEHNQKRYKQKLDRLNKLSEIERVIIIKRESQLSNDWRKAWRKRMKLENPAVYEEFLMRCRLSQRKTNASKQLNSLFKAAQELQKMQENED